MRRGAPSTAERHRAAARSLGGCGRARSVPIAEPSFGAEPQAPAPEEGFAVPAAVFVVVAVEDVRMFAVPFVACPRPVSARPVPGVLGCPRPVSGVRCRVRRVSAVRVSVSVRLASASALSAQAGVCGARRCRAAPRLGRADLGVVARRVRERPVFCPSLARMERRRPCWASGGVGRGPGRCPGMRSGGGCGHVSTACRPGQPVGAEGRPSVG